MLHNLPFVVLEKDPIKLEKLKSMKNILFLEADAVDDPNFITAGISQANSVISTLPSDADNVFVVLMARQLISNHTIISRVTNPKTEAKLRFSGANNDRIISVSDLESKESSLLRVIGVKKDKGKGYILTPSNETRIEKRDKIFVLGKKEDNIVLRKGFGLV
jgi:Trk K+ transport system NAD-binding subunit